MIFPKGVLAFISVAEPSRLERWLILLGQGVFFNVYFVLYLFAPRIAHRVVGYLEEEAVISYTQYLAEVDEGRVENVPAPQLAIDYWKLPQDARLRDVIIVVRADEAGHRAQDEVEPILHGDDQRGPDQDAGDLGDPGESATHRRPRSGGCRGATASG